MLLPGVYQQIEEVWLWMGYAPRWTLCYLLVVCRRLEYHCILPCRPFPFILILQLPTNRSHLFIIFFPHHQSSYQFHCTHSYYFSYVSQMPNNSHKHENPLPSFYHHTSSLFEGLTIGSPSCARDYLCSPLMMGSSLPSDQKVENDSILKPHINGCFHFFVCFCLGVLFCFWITP